MNFHCKFNCCFGVFLSLLSDAVAIVMIVTASGVGLSLLIIFIVMICFSKQKWWVHWQIVCYGVIYSHNSLFLTPSSPSIGFFCRLKRHFWPVVPDPANSSMKRWTSESTQVLKMILCKTSSISWCCNNQRCGMNQNFSSMMWSRPLKLRICPLFLSTF